MTIAALSERFALVEFVEAHRTLGADAERCRLGGAGTVGLAPLAFALGDDAVTFLPGASLTIAEGIDAAATCVVAWTDARAFADFFHELRTVPGAQLSGGFRYLVGGYAELDDWEPALRALYQGRPVYDPGAVDRARLDRTFRHGVDDPAEIGAFVRDYGFAVVRGVFDPDEIASIDAALTRLEAASTPDTPGTWWTTSADGTAQACQLHYTSMRAPELAWMERDARVTQLVDACLPGLVPHPDRMNGHFAVLKRPGAHTGLTDLPWHIDCGLGGHMLMCPGLHIGVQLTASDPERGAFSVLAGSQFSTVRRSAVDTGTWPVVTVATQPGDVTIHVPHLTHAAPAPTGTPAETAGRRTLYLGFGRPEAHELIGPGRSFDDLISDTADDGFVAFEPRPDRA